MAKRTIKDIKKENNVKVQERGNQLIITIDLEAPARLSSGMKTMLIGSTGGNVGLIQHGDIFMNLNVMRSATKEDIIRWAQSQAPLATETE